MTKDNQYALNSQESYNLKLTTSIGEIQTKYNHLLSEYIFFILENVKIKNSTFLKFIMNRGLLTITNVFNIILFYTKNIDVAYFHSQKAFYFYVEFIGQISEDHHTFLQLSSRDATLFVYKKTIFYISNELNQPIHDKTEIKLLKKSEMLQHIYQCLFKNVCENFDFSIEVDMRDHVNKIEKILQKIIHVYKFSHDQLNTIQLFIEKINEQYSYDNLYETIEIFLKKYYTRASHEKNIEKNILQWNLGKEDKELSIEDIKKEVSCLF